MTLRQQFDDIMKMVDDIKLADVDEEFIETVVGATKIKDETKLLEEKFCRFERTLSKKEKQLLKLRKKLERER